MEFKVDIIGDRPLALSFDRMPPVVRAILKQKIGGWVTEIEEKVIELIGEGTMGKGTMASSVFARVTEEEGMIRGIVGYDLTKAPYAAIQDQGGQTGPHMIYAREARVLAFMGATGDKVFASHVFHPGSRFRGRHFMRDAVRSISASIGPTLRRVIVQGIRQTMRMG